MELEQRVGRVHRFGSLRTILVYTLVVQGTREVDAYRVAREKLQVAFGDLANDPQRFEALFSRVMSLIPPQQFEELLGAAPAGPISRATSEALGELVEQGLRSWKAFDKEFASQRAAIAGLNPGTATWEDVEKYLTDFVGAEPLPGWAVPAFEEAGDEVVSTLVDVPALRLDGQVFARVDSAGLLARDGQGREATPLGLNASAVLRHLRASALPERPTGAARLRPKDGGVAAFDAVLPPGVKRPFGLAAFIRQEIRVESGNALERGVELRVFVVRSDGEMTEPDPPGRAALVRALMETSRVQNPDTSTSWPETLKKAESRVIPQLGRPTPDQFRDGVRYAVWPILAAVVV